MFQKRFGSVFPYGILIFFILTAVLLILPSCSQKEPVSEEKGEEWDFDPERVVGIGRIEPEARILELTSEVPGIVKEIHFKPGDFIQEGSVLLTLSNSVEMARVEQKKAQIQTQKSRILAAEAALSSVQIQAENARANFMRAKTLYERNAGTKKDFDQSQSEYEALLEDTKRLEAEVVAAKDLLYQEKLDLEVARRELSLKSVKILSSGQLLSLDITLGSFLHTGEAFGTFAPDSPLIARCEIDELFADRVKVGQRAYIRKQGETEALAEGRVSFAGPSLRRKSIFSDEVDELVDRRVREVEIKLDKGAGLLIGSRVECVIFLEE